jgi:hypothetical protein
MIKSANMLHQLAIKSFSTELEIVGMCDILSNDQTWQNLYSCFFPFKSFEFKPNQRFLILHHDTDYYPSMGSCGNTIYNIIKIIAELDISTDHIIILTASLENLQHEVEYQCQINNLSPIKTIDFSLWYTWPPNLEKQVVELPEKKYLFSCLNGVPRTHRKTLLALLHQSDLINDGMISWHPHDMTRSRHDPEQKSKTGPDYDTNCVFRVTSPINQHINEELSLCSASKKLHVNYQTQLNQSIKSTVVSGEPNSLESRWVADYLQHSLVYIVVETVGQYPHVYLSEKTWKAMMSMMPFMILGARGSLTKLKKMGFKTFSDFWSEEYDQLPTPFERATAIVNNLLLLKKQDINTLYANIRPILLHNQQHMSTMQNTELEKIKNLI